jgi:hypothetical protein
MQRLFESGIGEYDFLANKRALQVGMDGHCQAQYIDQSIQTLRGSYSRCEVACDPHVKERSKRLTEQPDDRHGFGDARSIVRYGTESCDVVRLSRLRLGSIRHGAPRQKAPTLSGCVDTRAFSLRVSRSPWQSRAPYASHSRK